MRMGKSCGGSKGRQCLFRVQALEVFEGQVVGEANTTGAYNR